MGDLLRPCAARTFRPYHPEFRTAFSGKGSKKRRVRGSAHNKRRHPERSASARKRRCAQSKGACAPFVSGSAFDFGRLVRPGPSSSQPPPSACMLPKRPRMSLETVQGRLGIQRETLPLRMALDAFPESCAPSVDSQYMRGRYLVALTMYSQACASRSLSSLEFP